MKINRIYTAMIVVALVALAAFSVREAIATSAVASEVDSASHPYDAWVEKLEGSGIDSATRSYIAWGKALEAAGKEGFMVPVTVNSLAPEIAWAKACGVDLSYANNVDLDSATRSYISLGMAMQCANTP